jgi:hypothetical protein
MGTVGAETAPSSALFYSTSVNVKRYRRRRRRRSRRRRRVLILFLGVYDLSRYSLSSPTKSHDKASFRSRS